MENHHVILFVGGTLFLVALCLSWCYGRQFGRATKLLQAWAKRHAYRILHADLRFANRGPYQWSSNAHFVFYLTVEDEDGQTHKGWLRGNYWSSAHESIDVTWES